MTPSRKLSTAPPTAAALSRIPLLSLQQLLAENAVVAAAGLLGCELVRCFDDGRILRAMIVETEAYHMLEPGCHAYRGMTPRTAVMFGPPGMLYVYFTYGMWHCCNVVCGPEGEAAAVLLRAAAEIPAGAGDCPAPAAPLRLSGPGLLCRGLQLTREHNGINLLDPASPLRLHRPAGWLLPPVMWTTRIGFSFEDTYHWRAVWAGHPAISPGRPGVLARKKKDRPG